jgi:hypothetical protein
MIYTFRIVLDLKDEDIIRDIEIRHDATFEDLHNSIVQACDLDGQQMASFYTSNDKWEQKQEITLFNMDDFSDSEEEKKVMSEWALHELVDEDHHKLLYVYDFLNMWTFFIELLNVHEESAGVEYPRIIQAIGLMPEEAPDTEFKGEDMPKDLDNFDVYNGDDIFDQGGYDEFNEDWN